MALEHMDRLRDGLSPVLFDAQTVLMQILIVGEPGDRSLSSLEVNGRVERMLSALYSPDGTIGRDPVIKLACLLFSIDWGEIERRGWGRGYKDRYAKPRQGERSWEGKGE